MLRLARVVARVFVFVCLSSRRHVHWIPKRPGWSWRRGAAIRAHGTNWSDRSHWCWWCVVGVVGCRLVWLLRVSGCVVIAASPGVVRSPCVCHYSSLVSWIGVEVGLVATGKANIRRLPGADASWVRCAWYAALISPHQRTNKRRCYFAPTSSQHNTQPMSNY